MCPESLRVHQRPSFEDTAPAARSATRLRPVVGGRRKDGLAAGRLCGPIERVGDRLPFRVVRRLAVRLERGLVLVDLVEVIDVLVLLVLEDVEAMAVLLVPLGTERIDFDPFEEALALLRLDPDLDPDRDHGVLLVVRVGEARLLYRDRAGTACLRGDCMPCAAHAGLAWRVQAGVACMARCRRTCGCRSLTTGRPR